MMDNLSVSLQFKTAAEVGPSLFQVPSVDECIVGVVGRPGRPACYQQYQSIPRAAFQAFVAGAKPVCHCIFAEPAANYSLPNSVSYPLVRWTNYDKDGTLTRAAGNNLISDFSMIKLESSPLYIAIFCRPREGSQPTYALADQDEFMALYTGAALYDERAPNVLTVSSSASGGLASTFSARELYEMYCANQKVMCPRKKCYSWEVWRDSKCVILLRTSDLTSQFPPQSVYKPSVFSLKVSHQWRSSRRHQALEVPDSLPVRTSLCFCYCDSLTVASGSSSVSSTLVSAQQMSSSGQAPRAEPGRALESMEVKYPEQ